MNNNFFLLLLLLLLSNNGFSQINSSFDSPSLYLKNALSDENSGPEVWENYFILNYSNKHTRRFVGVAFEHENYATIHRFKKNSNNNYVFYAELPKVNSIRYRLVVDSVWQDDPKNSHFEIDQSGVKVSILNLPIRTINYQGPQVHANGIVDFYLTVANSSQVFITGSFSKWDPFMYPMTEVGEGIYKISIPLSRGIYYYSFIVNGQRILDPANLSIKVMNSTGEQVNELNTHHTL